MSSKKSARNSIEILEQRIAPAGLVLNEAGFRQATPGANLLHAGQGLTTGNGAGSGQYLLYVQSGSAIVFITDLNNNSAVDPNEITGIAAGDGLSLISFVDIHGDIVTDLTPSDTLSDSDRNPANNPPDIGGDGRILLNSHIESIVLRSVQASDFAVNSTTDTNGDGVVDQSYVDSRMVLSNYSIYGNILAGKGFGSTTGGLLIDDSGKTEQSKIFDGILSVDYYIDSQPSIGSILTGTKAGGKYFSFGISRNTDFAGYLVDFVPPAGQVGGDIIGIKGASVSTTFNVGTIESGDGGIGARGGNISGLVFNGDSSGYKVIAGNGGRGPVGGNGGGISSFSDLGSVTSYVLLQSGDGGFGSTGTGGAGGILTLGTVNLAAGLNIKLGDGGSGFTAGGNGAILSSGAFTAPEGNVPAGLNITSTMHVPGAIGSTSMIDFDGDGLGDYVYTTTAPDQIVVVLGTGEKIYLQGPRNVVAVQVGDFNDDGHPDVAVASNDGGNAGGISVFLNQYDSTKTKFSGFELPRFSPLPTLYKTEATTPGFTRSSNSIYSLAAGDFDGDGHTDLAVVATYLDPFPPSQPKPEQVLLVMKNDVENGQGTGRFYGDFGIKGDGNPQVPDVVLSGINSGSGTFIAKASVAQVGDPFDTIYTANIVGTSGTGQRINTYQLGPGIVSPVATGQFALGKVDTNRNLASTNPNITLTDAFVKDFTILDFGSTPGQNGIPTAADQVADIAVLTVAPVGYVVTLLGDPSSPTSGLATAASNPQGGQNSGIYFGAPANGAGGFDVGTVLQAIRTTDADGNGVANEISVLNYTNSSGQTLFKIQEVSVIGSDANNGLGQIINSFVEPGSSQDPSVVAFDTFQPIAGVNSWVNLVATPTTDPVEPHSIDTVDAVHSLLVTSVSEVANSINIFAGNGGNALAGKGGTGGGIGGGLNTVSVLLPINPAFEATLAFVAGDGGNGFSTGGFGGKVSGLNVRYTVGTTVLYATVAAYAGDGGYGVAGAGGAGGNLSLNSVASGVTFVAGNGGRGSTGGAGGSVIGNGVKNLFDTSDTFVQALAGDGGSGVTSGGKGGNVINFHAQHIPIVGKAGGAVYYTGGNGGNAAAGAGGSGGSITNSSPFSDVNAMAGEIYLRGGDGGTGTVGGAGGAITNYHNNPTTNDNPTIVSFIGGNGGAGTSGNGGVGGSITSVSTPSVGKQDLLQVFVSGFLFDRVIAGSGGASAGATGGAGGSISATSVSAGDGSIAFIAGSGGRGLAAGGIGGSVVNANTSLGQNSLSKVLVVAGAGGDAYAFVTNPLDNPPTPAAKPFGGKVGRGGNGGSITGFSEDVSVQAKVDLIAGNGGSTVNYGTITSPSFVGKGGSITNVTIAGNIGSGHAVDITDPALTAGGNTALRDRANVPIKSYTDIDGNGVDDETMDQLVQSQFRFSPTDSFVPITLDDSIGNVGVIVGAAGRLKLAETSPGIYTSLPAKGGVNGSLTNVSARNLLSAVAGSVNQIAAITTVSGLKIGSGTGANFTPGVVGSDKDPTLYPFPQPPDTRAVADPTPGSIYDYLDVNGQGVIEAQLDGRLIDGAVVAGTVNGFVAGRVYLR